MEHRAELLRHRIDLYRQRLSAGVSEVLANVYRCDLAVAETQLIELEERIGQQRKKDTAETPQSH